ncbi:MAG: hypothetical protein ACTSUC_00795 [Promethearchaeota archaeon]
MPRIRQENFMTTFSFQGLSAYNKALFRNKALSKGAQTILLYLFSLMLMTGKKILTIKQRALALKLGKHYNTIYLTLHSLQENNFLTLKNERSFTTILFNLDKIELPFYLALLSNSFAKILHSKECLYILDSEDGNKLEKYLLESKQFEEQAFLLIENKGWLAKQLSQEIVETLKEAQRTTFQVLDSEDYFVIISQVFANIPEFFEDTSFDIRIFSNAERIHTTYSKLGRY